MLPTPTLSADAAHKLDSLLSKVVDYDGTLSTCFILAANAEQIIYENQAGDKIYGDKASGKVDRDSVLQLYSSDQAGDERALSSPSANGDVADPEHRSPQIAALRLIEQGRLTLDDPDIVAQHFPEIASQKILKGYKDADVPADQQQPGQEIWEEPRTRITLRMLLSHTAGFGYPFANPLLQRYEREHPRVPHMVAGASSASYVLPLLYDPGSGWSYGVAMDWVGFLISRITGQTLEEHFQTEIFEPLGLASLTFLPTPKVNARLVSWVFRDAEGKMQTNKGLAFGRPATAGETTDHSGGAGLLGSLHDYIRFLQAVLACSPQASAEPRYRLISKQSFELLFKPAVPIPYELRSAVNPSDPPSNEASPALHQLAGTLNHGFGWDPAASPESLNHSIGFAVHTQDVPGGRPAGTGGWFGLMRTPAFIDPKNGLVFVAGTQELGAAMPDTVWPTILTEIESSLYAGLSFAPA